MRTIPTALVLFLCGAGSLAGQAAATRIDVCVVSGGRLQEVAADYHRASGDTTVAGRPFASVYPSTAAHYAAARPWYVGNDPIDVGGSWYVKYGLPRVLGATEVVPASSYAGVPMFAEPGAAAPAEVLYAPVRAGCEFQPYQHLAGVVGLVAVGETRTGTVTASDPEEDGRRYEMWLLEGRAGDVIEVDLESEDFDAYLVLAGGLAEPMASDDDGDGLDSRIQFAFPENGLYQLGVSTADAGETGEYSLRVAQPAWARALRTRRVLSYGEEAKGQLTASDPKTQGVSYHDYLYSANEDETVTFELLSPDFDAYLCIGRMVGAGFVEIDHDDDGGDDLNSELDFTAPAQGVYVLRVRTADAGETGSYALRAGVLPMLSSGETVTGDIAATDPVLDDDRHFDEFGYEARKGETVVIDLASTAFDPVVYVGVDGATDFEFLKSDDDGGEGNDSRLEFTFPGAGLYYIGVTHATSAGSGAYVLRVRPR